MARAAGDSSEQRSAERIILDAVGEHVGTRLKEKHYPLEGSAGMKVDGYAADPRILCEAWAHIGPAKGGQVHKVMNDALRLFLARSLEDDSLDCRAILAFWDKDAAARFQGKSWMAAALKRLDIEVLVVDVPSSVKAAVRAAQQRQRR